VKSITLVPYGGLANRIYAISSAIDLCRDNNMKLNVVWFKDKGLAAKFCDLFVLSPPHLLNNVFVCDAKWYHYLLDRPRKRNLWLTLPFQFIFFGAGFYFYWKKHLHTTFDNWLQTCSQKKTLYVSVCSPIYPKYQSIKLFQPVRNVTMKLNESLKSITPHTVGVHIRRTDHAISIRESPIELFVEKIKKCMDSNPQATFYVASDSADEITKLKEIFGDKIVTQNKIVRRDTKDGIVHAVVELYTLAATQKIFGSSNSTFSALAADINKIPLEICTQSTN
jgi:hypothetical protein